MANDKIVTGDRLEYFKGKLDETYAKKSEISSGADWAAQEGEDGFIQNKPFDVETIEEIKILDENITYYPEMNKFKGEISTTIFDDSKVGKTTVVKIDNNVISSTPVVKDDMEGMSIIYTAYNMHLDVEGFIVDDYPCYSIANFGESTLIQYSDGQSHTFGDEVNCEVFIDGTVLTKLPIEKTNVSWKNLPDKPFDVETGGQVVLFDGVLDEVNTYDYPDKIWHSGDEKVFTKEDVGKILIFDVDGQTFEAEIRLFYDAEDGYGLAAASYIHDPEDENIVIEHPSVEMFYQYSYEDDEANFHYGYYDDRTFVEGDSVPCKVTMDGTILTKLSADKIQIDGETIVNDNGMLSADIPIASPYGAGKVQPDGTTITIDDDGVISATAPPQVQADWNEDDSTSVSYIQNKPTIPPSVTVDDALSMNSENPVQNKVITSKLTPILGAPTDPSDQPINFSFSQPIPFHNPTGSQKLLQCVALEGSSTAYYVEIIVEPDPSYPLEFDYLDFYLGKTSRSFDFINNALCLVVKNNATSTGHFKATYYKYGQTGTLYGSYSVNLDTDSKSSSETDFERGNFIQSSSQTSTRIYPLTKATPINCEFKSGRAAFSTYVEISIPPVLNYTINGEIPKTPWEQINEKVTTLETSTQPKLTAGENITIDENNVISASGGSPITTTKTLSSSSWTNKSQIINITGVTANSIILVGPDSASSQDWFDDEVRCSAQGSGTLTFVCGNTPTTDITVQIAILG